MKLFALAVCVLRNPISVFSVFKGIRRETRYFPAIVLYLLFLVVRLLSLFIVHYPVATTTALDANMVLEVVFYLVPPISFAICSYLVSSIMDGESFLKENIIATSFCLMPYIVFTLPVTLFTRIIGITDIGIYNALQTVIWVFVFVLGFLSIKYLNDFSFGKTILIIAITGITLFLFWAVIVLIYSLASQFITFIVGFYKELTFILANK